MINEFLAGHRKFRHKKSGAEADYLRRLANQHQSPDALFIGCSDSRVVPEMLTHSNPGELFVIRNVANRVPPFVDADASVGAAIDYAVSYLHVPHIIVCGHYGCGGVKAACDGLDPFKGHESLHQWLSGILPAVQEADRAPGKDRVATAVEIHVLQQRDALLTYPAVADAVADDRVELHAWIYDMTELTLWVFDEESEQFLRATELLNDR